MKNYKRFVVASDPHGDMEDPVTKKALFSFIDDFKPEIRVHAGDGFDFRNLRRGASDDEKAHSLEDDWGMGSDWMRTFFDGGKENHFLRGNHDERLWHFASSATGLLRDYANEGIKRMEALVRKSKAKMLPYDVRHGVFPLGNLNVVHGYYAGMNAARRHAISFQDCLFGHCHSTDSATVESPASPVARGLGCCCLIDMGYNQHLPGKLRHSNSWAYGQLFSDGSYELFQTRKINGSFYAAQTIKEY